MKPQSLKAYNFFITIDQNTLWRMGLLKDEEKKHNLSWENHFSDRMESIEDYIGKTIEDMDGSYYGCWATSDGGHFHGHIAINFKTRRSINSIRKLFGVSTQGNIVQQGTKADAIAYIEKTGKFEEKGEVIHRLWGDKQALRDKQGERYETEEFDKAAVSPDFDLNDWLLQHINESNMIAWNYYQKRFSALLQQKTENRDEQGVKVYYIEGEGGEGKTYGVYQRHKQVFDAPIENQQFPFDGYQGEEVLLLDELKPYVFSKIKKQVFNALDRYKQRINIKGGQSFAGWNTVYITSAFPLRRWFNPTEQDKQDNTIKSDEALESMRRQFYRRIDKHYIAIAGEWFEDEEWVKTKRELGIPLMSMKIENMNTAEKTLLLKTIAEETPFNSSQTIEKLNKTDIEEILETLKTAEIKLKKQGRTKEEIDIELAINLNTLIDKINE